MELCSAFSVGLCASGLCVNAARALLNAGRASACLFVQMCRLAILNCEDKERWRGSVKVNPLAISLVQIPSQKRTNVEGHVNRFVEMFIDTYGEATDQFRAYSVGHTISLRLIFGVECYDYEWPSVSEAGQFDALFITGANYSVYDQSETWIPELCHMVQLYVQEDVRVIGICFGAQAGFISSIPALTVTVSGLGSSIGGTSWKESWNLSG